MLVKLKTLASLIHRVGNPGDIVSPVDEILRHTRRHSLGEP